MVALRELSTWRIPLGLNLVLLTVPAVLVALAFGGLGIQAAGALLAGIAVLALLAGTFGRAHPLTLVRPWEWRRKPWLFAIYTLFFWAIFLIGPFGGGAARSLANWVSTLALAVWFVFFTTTGRHNGDSAR